MTERARARLGNAKYWGDISRYWGEILTTQTPQELSGDNCAIAERSYVWPGTTPNTRVMAVQSNIYRPRLLGNTIEYHLTIKPDNDPRAQTRLRFAPPSSLTTESGRIMYAWSRDRNTEVRDSFAAELGRLVHHLCDPAAYKPDESDYDLLHTQLQAGAACKERGAKSIPWNAC